MKEAKEALAQAVEAAATGQGEPPGALSVLRAYTEGDSVSAAQEWLGLDDQAQVRALLGMFGAPRVRFALVADFIRKLSKVVEEDVIDMAASAVGLSSDEMRVKIGLEETSR